MFPHQFKHDNYWLSKPQHSAWSVWSSPMSCEHCGTRQASDHTLQILWTQCLWWTTCTPHPWPSSHPLNLLQNPPIPPSPAHLHIPGQEMCLVLLRPVHSWGELRGKKASYIIQKMLIKQPVFELTIRFLHKNGIEFHQKLIGICFRGLMTEECTIWRKFYWKW